METMCIRGAVGLKGKKIKIKVNVYRERLRMLHEKYIRKELNAFMTMFSVPHGTTYHRPSLKTLDPAKDDVSFESQWMNELFEGHVARFDETLEEWKRRVVDGEYFQHNGKFVDPQNVKLYPYQKHAIDAFEHHHSRTVVVFPSRRQSKTSAQKHFPKIKATLFDECDKYRSTKEMKKTAKELYELLAANGFAYCPPAKIYNFPGLTLNP